MKPREHYSYNGPRFEGKLPMPEELAQDCPYDFYVGGSLGCALCGKVPEDCTCKPFTDDPRRTEDCAARGMVKP